MPDRNRYDLSLLALGITILLAAPTASFAASNVESATGGYTANADVLSDRHCTRGPKQEICDWVKRDHKTTTGH